MMKLKKAFLLSFVILIPLFTAFSTEFTSTEFVVSAKASPMVGEHAYYTLTLNTSSKDATIDGLSADWNFGADFRLDFGFNNYTNSASRILVQFDLPPALSGANITSATLKLWGPNPWSSGDPSGEALRACRVTHEWVEGTGKWGALTQDGVTWNEYNYSDGLTTATNDWGTPGGDYTLTDSSTVTIPSYPLPSPFRNWTVTNIVKGWASGTYPNCGFLIKLDNEPLSTYKGGVFNSKEYGQEYGEEYAPKLEITYTAPTVESCNSVGDQQDYFDLGETVYVSGSGFSPSTTYDFFIVEDAGFSWNDGMIIPVEGLVPDTATTILSNAQGDIDPTPVWNNPQILGKFDIVVDVNGNGQYDAGVDALDDSDVEITAGFSVIPEFSSILPLFMTATLLTVIVYRRKSAN